MLFGDLAADTPISELSRNSTTPMRTLDQLSRTQQLYWDSGTGALRSLLHSSEDFNVPMLVAFSTMHFFTTCWTYGLGVPSGLFVPSLLCGAAFGRLAGQAVHGWRIATPGIYALVGAAAMLSGTARITISLAMIIMEVVGEAGFSLPIFITVMAARWVGNMFGRGIYDLHIIDLKRVPLLEHDPEDEMLKMRVGQVMATDIVSFHEIELCGDIHMKLCGCSHNGFPVARAGRVVGVLSRDVLHFLLMKGDKYGLFDDPPRLVPFQPMHGELALVRPGLATMSTEMAGRLLDLRPYMSKDFHVMADTACLFGVYDTFRKLGLRHLFVTSEETGLLCGVVTRKNLILMEEEDVDPKQDPEISSDDEDDEDEPETNEDINEAQGPVHVEDKDLGFGEGILM